MAGVDGDGLDHTQPFVVSQSQPEIDPTIHARLISLLPADVPSCDMKAGDIVIGRNPEVCHLTVKDKRVSGKHIRIYRDKFAYYVEALGSAPTWHQGQLVKKGDVRTLASGDSLSLLFNTSAVPTHSVCKERVADFLFQIIRPKNIHDHENNVESQYQILKELGSGNFSKVLLGISKEDARNKVAIKKINIEVFETLRRKRETKLTIKSEIEVLRRLNHKNIVQLFDIFKNESELCLVMELCEGGDLLHNILKQGAFSEVHGHRLFGDLLTAVRHLHDRNIVHRDFKPDNVLLTTANRDTMAAKITDFGLAVEQGGLLREAEAAVLAVSKVAQTVQNLRVKTTMCRTFCGTPHYLAPEVIQAGRADSGSNVTYGKEVDMWSMGVMLYIILSAVPPFDDDGGNLYSRICGSEWDFDVEEFDSVSAESKELVRNLLKVDTLERLTVEQALRHPWLSIHSPCSNSGVRDMVVDESVFIAGHLVKRQKTGVAAQFVEGSVAFLEPSEEEEVILGPSGGDSTE